MRIFKRPASYQDILYITFNLKAYPEGSVTAAFKEFASRIKAEALDPDNAEKHSETTEAFGVLKHALEGYFARYLRKGGLEISEEDKDALAYQHVKVAKEHLLFYAAGGNDLDL